MTDEEYVRAKWSEVRKELRYKNALQMDSGSAPDEWIVYARDTTYMHPHIVLAQVWGSEAIAWAAAAEFTRERELQIAETQADMEWLKEARVHMSELHRPQRILRVLEAQLAELQRGMKQ